LGLLKATLMQGNFTRSRDIISNFPTSPEYAFMETLIPLFTALDRASAKAETSDDELEASYQNSLHLILRGNIAAAMDGLLDILRKDKHFHEDEARTVLLGIFEVLGNNHPLTQQYRKELAMVLF
jgi:putative thioredoxin